LSPLLPRFLRTALHPARYHGHGKKPPFFEGWYFKLVDATERHRYAIIPGMSLSRGVEEPHSFVQVLDGATGRSAYHRYPSEAFWAAEDAFHVRIATRQGGTSGAGETMSDGHSIFTAAGIRLEVDGPELPVRGEVRFREIKPWPVTVTSPGIMGWYAWAPFMQTYHGVVSLDHGLEGTLEIEGNQVDFTGGRGYIEKDWGRSFPDAWIWFQTNHFGGVGTSLTASIAVIPWLNRSFPGFIVGLWHRERLYRFATYTGAQTEQLDIREREVEWTIVDDTYRLQMVATRPQGTRLQAPTTGGMDRRIGETMNARVDVRCTELSSGRVVFAGTGRHAGLETEGELARLLAT
jgi:tocopherol cyclase